MRITRINTTPNRIKHSMQRTNVCKSANLLKAVNDRLSRQRFERPMVMDVVAQNMLAHKPVDVKMQDLFDKLPKQKQDEYLLFAKLKLENPQT